MILKCIKQFHLYSYDPPELMATTVNKTYQCLPAEYGYAELWVFNDNHEWKKYPLQAFAPLEPKPIISWEE